MKNKIFNKGLYVEGLKQLRMVGIIAFVIFSLEAILFLIGWIVRISPQPKIDYFGLPKTYDISAFLAHPILLLAFIVFAPIFVMTLFGFLNKRNTADFYHSLPHSRTAIFTSFFASVLTWLAIIIFGSSLISSIGYLIFSNTLSLDYIGLLKLSLNCFAASALVASAIALAMTITGTIFSNLIISGLILFLPRFAMSSISSAITSQLPMVPPGQLGEFLSNKLNIVTGTVFIIFTPFNWVSDYSMVVLDSLGAFAYTIVLAVIYAVVACVLFKKRKSEDAGNAAPNRVLQAIYRITITMAFCVIICITIMRENKYSTNNTFKYIVLYIIAALIYFIYELVTTKRWKNLLRAIPGLAIVAALNGMVLSGMYGIYNLELNYTPTPDEIKSVSVILGDDRYFNYSMKEVFSLPINKHYTESSISYEDYLWYTNPGVEMKDEQAITFVSNSLKTLVESQKYNQKNYREPYYYGIKPLTIKIKTNKGVKQRIIRVDDERPKELYDALFETDEYQQMNVNVPEYKFGDIKVSQSDFGISGRAVEEIYAVMREELKEVKFSDWWQARDKAYEAPALIYSFEGKIGAANIPMNIPLIKDFTPKAAEMFNKELRKKGTYHQLDNFIQNISENNTNVNIDMDIRFHMYDDESQSFVDYEYKNTSTNKSLDALKFLFKNTKPAEITSETSYVEIALKVYETKEGLEDGKFVYYYFIINNDEGALLKGAIKIE